MPLPSRSPALPAALFLVAALCAPATAQLNVTHPRIEYRIDPVGIDAKTPRFSWRLESAARNTMQIAYEIQVASDSDDLRASRRILWSSGRQSDSNSTFRPYAGPSVTSRTRYYWRVRVWDNQGRTSSWSPIAFWENGLLSASDWQAHWIASPDAHDSAGAPAPIFRREFNTSGRIISARAYVTARGLYELHINGKRVGEDFFTPGWTSYQNRLQYQTYDVTGFITPGANAIGAMLGDGWYRGYLGFSGRKNDYGTRTALLVQLEIRYANGRVERVLSDSSWSASTGAIRYADIYRGESYDARLDQPGWDRAGFDQRTWQRAAPTPATNAALVAPVSEPVRRTQSITPIAIIHAPNGETLVDLGQNITGWVKLRVNGRAGQVVTLRHAEVLDKAGNLYTENLRAADQTDRYTMRGNGEEIYEPHFTYHGFRYVSVTGLDIPVTLGTVTGIVVHSDLEETGVFETSDTMINRLQRNILWGQRGNFLDIPTDCPQRDERLGWTGDAQVFARTAAFNMNVSGFFAKWLGDLAADQHPGGSVPWVIPNPLGGDSARYAGTPGWSDASTVVPWTMYLMYGDRGLLERQFKSMSGWVDYAARRVGPDGVWHTDGFGDWLALHSDDASYPGATTGKDFIATAYLAHSADIVARAASVLGRTQDAGKYRALVEQVRSAFRREFVSPNGRVSENTQTAYALALNFGLLDSTQTAGAARRLADDIRDHDRHLTTGFLGTPELSRALSENGFRADAFALLMQRTYPSWLYPITRGATTMWERWDGIRPDGSFEEISMNSFNHYAFGAIGDWMYRTIGGLDIDQNAPGYQHSLVAVHPGGGLTSARTELMTGYGKLATSWQLAGNVMALHITVPANTWSTVTISGVTVEMLHEGNGPVQGTAGVRSVKQVGADVVVVIGSGEYFFHTM